MTVHPLRPATRHRLGRPSPHQQADRPRAHPPPKQYLSRARHATDPEYPVLATLSCGYPEEGGRLLTCYSPVRHSSRTSKLVPSPFDLHVLSTPPAFVLSQDQTLQTKPTKPGPNQPQTNSQPEPTVSTTVQKTRPGPTQPQKKKRARQTKTKQTPKTTHNQNHAQPQGHGIKNMTHYRVLKQHTQPELIKPSDLTSLWRATPLL